METSNLMVNITFAHGETGHAASNMASIPPGYRPIFAHLPNLAADSAALIVRINSLAGLAAIDGYDEDSGSAEPLHINCAQTNVRVKRLDPSVFAGVGSFQLYAVASDLSTPVPQAVGVEAGDVVVQIECRRY